MIKVGALLHGTEGCCGITQVTDFSDAWEGRWQAPDVEGSGKTMEEAYKNLFARLQEVDPADEDHGKVFQMWFMCPSRFDGSFEPQYKAEELRLLIETIPNVRNLGEFVNYKSGNKIQGYQWEQ